MTTWGTKPFDNDAAIDLFERIEPLDDAEAARCLRDTLRGVAERPGVVEVHEAHAAIAAASLVAASGAGGSIGSARVDEWLSRRRPAVTAEDQRLALRALERVRGPESEWPELWSTTDREGVINARIDDLRAALSG